MKSYAAAGIPILALYQFQAFATPGEIVLFCAAHLGIPKSKQNIFMKRWIEIRISLYTKVSQSRPLDIIFTSLCQS